MATTNYKKLRFGLSPTTMSFVCAPQGVGNLLVFELVVNPITSSYPTPYPSPTSLGSMVATSELARVAKWPHPSSSNPAWPQHALFGTQHTAA